MRQYDSETPFFIWDSEIPDLEPGVFEQIDNTLQVEVNGRKVVARGALMPDAHVGYGVPIGAVLAMRNVIPGAVGVDIGCGMIAQTADEWNEDDLNYAISEHPDFLKRLYTNLKRAVPMGMNWFGKSYDQNLDDIPDEYYSEVAGKFLGYRRRFGLGDMSEEEVSNFESKTLNQLGTLGSGNHFLEICINDARQVVVLLHSGSRGFGRHIADYYIKIAKKRNRFDLDPNLSALDTPLLKNWYLEAMETAQLYATLNRKVMLDRALQVVRDAFRNAGIRESSKDGQADFTVSCHHNYGSKFYLEGEEMLLVRKGAVDASKGVKGIIPGSMGNVTYITEGLGGDLNLNSCSHGAGRVMSRGVAKKQITVERHRELTANVYCDKSESILDESPDAYKPIDGVMASQKDLVSIIDTLRPVVNCKG